MAATVIGKNIRKYRKASGLTIEKLAQSIGSLPPYVWRLENRTPKNPSREKLAEIARVLNIPIESLYSENELDSDSDDEFYWKKFKSLNSISKTKVKRVIDMEKELPS